MLLCGPSALRHGCKIVARGADADQFGLEALRLGSDMLICGPSALRDGCKIVARRADADQFGLEALRLGSDMLICGPSALRDGCKIVARRAGVLEPVFEIFCQPAVVVARDGHVGK